ELAYSQFTHRFAGGVLLLLASVIAWESRRRQPRPWSWLSSVLWILFGLYLIPTSDPESWPAGPGRFVDIFTDSLVLQHKALAMVPIAFGVVGILRSAGVIERVRRTVLVPVLAVLAGVSLFAHFHDGHFHLDAIYVQHAAMGATAVGADVLRVRPRRRLMRIVGRPHELVDADEMTVGHADVVVDVRTVHLAVEVLTRFQRQLEAGREPTPLEGAVHALQVVREPPAVVLGRDDLEVREAVEHAGEDEHAERPFDLVREDRRTHVAVAEAPLALPAHAGDRVQADRRA